MAGSGKKRKAENTDFKRIKAKVGKRAVKPANVTDTRFKSASVSVKNQAVKFSSLNSKLVSERGHSIQDLTTQLNHPATAVRVSAIRGLANVVESHSESLKAHLSVLLPAVAKCCVDEDGDVRQLGLSVLRNILANENEQVLRPFLPLLTAYVTSALNSLDKSTRLDGGQAVDILSTSLPALMGSQAQILLPAFVALLSDYSHSHQRQSDSVAKKRKKSSDTTENRRFTILRSLVALLRTVREENREIESDSMKAAKPDFVFVPGGRTVNALLVAGRKQQFVRPIKSINDLSSFAEGSIGIDTTEKGGVSVSVATDIISKLRDIFIELSQRGGTEVTTGRVSLTATDAEELSLLNEAVGISWKAFARNMIRQATDPKSVEGLRKLFITVLSFMLESFPVQPQGNQTASAAKCSLLNADMCVTFMDIGSFLDVDSKGLNWTKIVLDYLLPRLDSDASFSIQGDTIIDVLSRLLMLKHGPVNFTLADKTRCKILKKICALYFAGDVKPDMAQLAASRRAALLIIEILKNENFVIRDDSPFNEALRLALKSLPFYLQSWRGNFKGESTAVLSALHDVARRLDLEKESSEDIVGCLRNGVTVICEDRKRVKGEKGSHSTIFELYSEEMQRKTLGLLVMVRVPSGATMNGLSDICARCSDIGTEGVVSPAIADAIMHAVHSVRRTISMQAYLSFIVASTGMTQLKRKKNQNRRIDVNPEDECEAREQPPTEVVFDLEMIKASEAPVLRAARYIVLSGSSKTLPMIQPVLHGWLARTHLNRSITGGSSVPSSQLSVRHACFGRGVLPLELWLLI